MKNIHEGTCDDLHPTLPIPNVTERSEAVHFYTNLCGHLMSARIMEVSTGIIFKDYCILLAFHKGSFDKFNLKLPKIFAVHENAFFSDNNEIELPVELDKQLPPDILNTISSCATIPQGVIKITTSYYFTCSTPKFTIKVKY